MHVCIVHETRISASIHQQFARALQIQYFYICIPFDNHCPIENDDISQIFVCHGSYHQIQASGCVTNLHLYWYSTIFLSQQENLSDIRSHVIYFNEKKFNPFATANFFIIFFPLEILKHFFFKRNHFYAYNTMLQFKCNNQSIETIDSQISM